VTFLFCLILVYIVVFRPDWPPYRLRWLGNRSGMPGSFARYYFRLARRRFVTYSATPITPSVEEYRNQHQLTPLLDFLRHLNAMLIGAPSIGAYVENGFSRKKWSRKPQRDQIWSTYRGDDAWIISKFRHGRLHHNPQKFKFLEKFSQKWTEIFSRKFQDLYGMRIPVKQNLKIGGQPPNLGVGEGQIFR